MNSRYNQGTPISGPNWEAYPNALLLSGVSGGLNVWFNATDDEFRYWDSRLDEELLERGDIDHHGVGCHTLSYPGAMNVIIAMR